MDKDTNALNWFEIPVTDMQRAKHFYQTAFSVHMDDMNMPGMEMSAFPAEMGNGKVSGCLIKGDGRNPSTDGITLYLNANPDMSDILERIQGEGSQVLLGKTQISPEIGYMAFFIDSEGNKIGLHSQG